MCEIPLLLQHKELHYGGLEKCYINSLFIVCICRRGLAALHSPPLGVTGLMALPGEPPKPGGKVPWTRLPGCDCVYGLEALPGKRLKSARGNRKRGRLKPNHLLFANNGEVTSCLLDPPLPQTHPHPPAIFTIK